MAGGELSAMFDGLASGAEQAGGDLTRSLSTVVDRAADIEDENLAGSVDAETQNARSFTDIGRQPDASQPQAQSVGSAATHPPASFGSSASTDYKRTFFTANPSTEGNVVVHHAVEQQTLRRYPGVVTPSEIHSLENLRGIPKGAVNNRVHLSEIRKAWNRFYKANPSPTKQQLLDFATQIDDQFGRQFDPPIR